jgi:hypothetical protein
MCWKLQVLLSDADKMDYPPGIATRFVKFF